MRNQETSATWPLIFGLLAVLWIGVFFVQSMAPKRQPETAQSEPAISMNLEPDTLNSPVQGNRLLGKGLMANPSVATGTNNGREQGERANFLSPPQNGSGTKNHLADNPLAVNPFGPGGQLAESKSKTSAQDPSKQNAKTKRGSYLDLFKPQDQQDSSEKQLAKNINKETPTQKALLEEQKSEPASLQDPKESLLVTGPPVPSDLLAANPLADLIADDDPVVGLQQNQTDRTLASGNPFSDLLNHAQNGRRKKPEPVEKKILTPANKPKTQFASGHHRSTITSGSFRRAPKSPGRSFGPLRLSTTRRPGNLFISFVPAELQNHVGQKAKNQEPAKQIIPKTETTKKQKTKKQTAEQHSLKQHRIKQDSVKQSDVSPDLVGRKSVQNTTHPKLPGAKKRITGKLEKKNSAAVGGQSTSPEKAKPIASTDRSPLTPFSAKNQTPNAIEISESAPPRQLTNQQNEFGADATRPPSLSQIQTIALKRVQEIRDLEPRLAPWCDLAESRISGLFIQNQNNLSADQTNSLTELNDYLNHWMDTRRFEDSRQENTLRIKRDRFDRIISLWTAIAGPKPTGHRQTQSRTVQFSKSLKPDWKNYLLWDQASLLGRGLSPNQESTIAQSILERYFHPNLDFQQARLLLKSIPADSLSHIAALAKIPVSENVLLEILQATESDQSVEIAPSNRLNEFGRRLAVSPNPATQRLGQTLNKTYRQSNFKLTFSRDFINQWLLHQPWYANLVGRPGERFVSAGKSPFRLEIIPCESGVRLELVPAKQNRINSDGWKPSASQQPLSGKITAGSQRYTSAHSHPSPTTHHQLPVPSSRI